MTFAYHSVFNVADLNNDFGTLTFSTTGKPDVVVDVSALTATPANSVGTTTRFANYHGSIAPTGQDADSTHHHWDELSSTSFDAVLEAAIQAEATAQGWTTPSSFTVTFSNTTLAYTFAYPTGITLFSFSTPATSSLLGFNGAVMGSWTTTASTQTPDFVIIPVLGDVSCVGGADGLNYEPDGITTDAVSASGYHFSMSRTVTPLCRDWVQQFETKPKSTRVDAVSTHPFCHERLRANCRNNLPFIVQDMFGETGAEMFKLRAESTAWKCEPASDAANHAQLHVSYGTYVLGSLS